MDGHFKTKPALQKPGRKRTPKPHGAGRNGADYFRGERIFQETDRPDSVYMLLNGSVINRKRDVFRKKDPSGAAGRSRGSVRGGFMPLWRKLPMTCMWKR